MQRKKILWLVSWYPNRNDKFDGDFVQRHAQAAAICHDIHVIYITDADNKSTGEEYNYSTGLTEQIIYFKKKKGIAARIAKQWTWQKLYKRAVKNYIAKNGLPQGVHVHVPWKAGLMALWVKRKYNIDFIITEHWTIYNDGVPSSFSRKLFLVKMAIKKIYEGAVGAAPVSNNLSAILKTIFSVHTTTVINNVVDATLFCFSEKKYSKFTFIHVSNMVPLKNVKGILDAFKQIMESNIDVQLIMIGNKSDEYVNYAKALGLLHTSVFFKGEIPYGEVAAEMQGSHCFLLNSWIENSPCVIGEALCCGIPVIATNVGGVPELIDESNGILITPGETKALAQAMKKICENYASFNAREIAERAAKKFNYNFIAEKFNGLYNSSF